MKPLGFVHSEVMRGKSIQKVLIVLDFLQEGDNNRRSIWCGIPDLLKVALGVSVDS